MIYRFGFLLVIVVIFLINFLIGAMFGDLFFVDCFNFLRHKTRRVLVFPDESELVDFAALRSFFVCNSR